MNTTDLILMFVATFFSIVATSFGLVGAYRCFKHRSSLKMLAIQLSIFVGGCYCILYVFNHVNF